jgi:hypothetical protein
MLRHYTGPKVGRECLCQVEGGIHADAYGYNGAAVDLIRAAGLKRETLLIHRSPKESVVRSSNANSGGKMGVDADAWTRAHELSGIANQLEKENDSLLLQFGDLVRRRMAILDDQPGRTSSPGARVAFEGLRASDRALGDAAQAIGTAGDELAKVSSHLEATIRSALQTSQATLDAREADAFRPEVQRAVDDLLSRADLGPYFCTVNVAATQILCHRFLIEIHDANAYYLDRKAYVRSQLLESGIKLLEGVGHDAAHIGVIVGGSLMGVAVPHILLVGTFLASVNIVYKLLQSQVKEARKKISAATDVFAKMYALQTLNEQCAADALAVRDFIDNAKASTEQQDAEMLKAEHALRVAELGIDDSVEEAQDLRSAQELLKKIKEQK